MHHGMNGIRPPVAQRVQLRPHLPQGLHRVLPQVLPGRLLVVALEVLVEEDRRLGHLVERLRPLAVGLGDRLGRRPSRGVHAQPLQLPFQLRAEALGPRLHDVMLVQPQELVRVHRRGRFVDVGDVEQLDHLPHGKHFLVAVGPAEADEVVQHGLGEVALLPVLQDADRAVALR